MLRMNDANDPHLIYQVLVAGVLGKEREESVEEIKQSETVQQFVFIENFDPYTPHPQNSQ